MKIRANNLKFKLLGRINGEFREITDIHFKPIKRTEGQDVPAKAYIELGTTLKGYPLTMFDEMIIEIPSKNISEVEDEPSQKKSDKK